MKMALWVCWALGRRGWVGRGEHGGWIPSLYITLPHGGVRDGILKPVIVIPSSQDGHITDSTLIPASLGGGLVSVTSRIAVIENELLLDEQL